MFIRLGNYLLYESDIKYIRWFSTTHSDNTTTPSAVICFRDGEELVIKRLTDSEKETVMEYWSNRFIAEAANVQKLLDQGKV